MVDSLDEALAHIARYGTHHSDGILTNTYAHAQPDAYPYAYSVAAPDLLKSTGWASSGRSGSVAKKSRILRD